MRCSGFRLPTSDPCKKGVVRRWDSGGYCICQWSEKGNDAVKTFLCFLPCHLFQKVRCDDCWLSERAWTTLACVASDVSRCRPVSVRTVLRNVESVYCVYRRWVRQEERGEFMYSQWDTNQCPFLSIVLIILYLFNCKDEGRSNQQSITRRWRRERRKNKNVDDVSVFFIDSFF